MEDNKKGTDIFGLAPYGEALKIVTEKSLDGVGVFLGKICVPAAEELGLMVRDKLKAWRLNNVISICEKSQGKLGFIDNQLQLSAHPRVVHEILDKGSLQDDVYIQDMWAGLLAASVNSSPEDENIIYSELLNRLTTYQAKLLNFICKDCIKKLSKDGLVFTESKEYDINVFHQITGRVEINSLNKDFMHLSSLGLITSDVISDLGAGVGGFYLNNEGDAHINLTASSLALHLYVKCTGFGGQLNDFFQLHYVVESPKENPYVKAYNDALNA